MTIRIAVTGLLVAAFITASSDRSSVRAQPKRPPNFIIILADDQGYGDLGS